jgi:DNA-binding transcriptional ArsR family regulator
MTYQSILQALADPTRHAVFEELRRGPNTVGRLALGLPVSRPAVSQHLRVLKDAGLVREEKQGTRRVYQVELQGLAELRRYLDGFWGDALRAFSLAAQKQAVAQAPRARGRKKEKRR